MPYKPNYKYIPPLNKDFLTPIYDFVSNLIGFGKRFLRRVLDAAEIQNGNTVLDIGCGTGVLLLLGKKKFPGASFIGVDPNEKALHIAKRRFTKANVDIKVIQAFGEDLPLPNVSIDVVASSLAFHHMPNKAKVKTIQEIKRVLKPGGRVVIADFGPTNVKWIPKLSHLFIHIEHLEGNLRGLIPKTLKETGFEDIQTVSKSFPSMHTIVAKKPLG